MSRAVDPAAAPAAENAPDAYVCPFCGLSEDSATERAEGAPCPRCGMSDTPSTRKATKARIGPWHVRQVRNPWAPGMKWDTLLSLIKRGQVTANSIVRGPTTHQLWRRAAHVKGLSREFGLCYSCGEQIEHEANLCPHCNRLQEPPANPDALLEAREAKESRQKRESPEPRAAIEVSNVIQPQAAPAPAPGPERGPEPEPAAEEVRPLSEPAPAPKRELAEIKSEGSNGNGNGKRRRPLEKLMSAPERPLNLPDEPATLEEGFKPPLAGMGDPPPPRREMPLDRPADALLTAQELATAFQLDFTPKKPRRAAGGRAMKVMLVLVMLALSVGCLLYVQPELREKGMAWARRQIDSVKSRTSTPPPEPTVAPVPKSQAPAPATKPSSVSAAPRQAPKTQPFTPVSVMPLIQTTPIPAPTRSPAPTTAPTAKVAITPPGPAQSSSNQAQPAAAVEKPKAQESHVVIAPAAPPPAPAPVKAETKPETKSAPKEQPKEESKPAPPPPASPDPVEQARLLWSKAIDAEIDGKFREAVQIYEQIKKLPADVHPEALDLRLNLAKKQIK